MMLIEETNVPDAALPVDALKAHLRMGSGFGLDDVQEPVLRSFLRAAIAAIEARTGKILLQRDFAWSVTYWRDASTQVLPVAPVQDVTRVALVARDGTASDVDADGYWLERDAHRPRLRATRGALPAVPPQGAVLVEFNAGFAPDWDTLRADLQQAVLLLAAHYYEYRDDTSLSEGCMPFGVSSLIERYKTLRLGAGATR